ncbi:hypothetical protein PR048_013628 [Dryococelus australis]|uniref:Uncharacterized protein n=1 Tax=Dryococelus australis TaxID=614101 RepID=A0ABQ9HSR1_9NEOP|nr:hypothetical protein PR048_013628 [Dryococelus australis]
MPGMFTRAEYAEVVFVYGYCDGNVRGVAVEYLRRRISADGTPPSLDIFLVQCLDYKIPRSPCFQPQYGPMLNNNPPCLRFVYRGTDFLTNSQCDKRTENLTRRDRGSSPVPELWKQGSCWNRLVPRALLIDGTLAGSSGAVTSALASHHGDPGPIPAGFAPGFSHVGIVLDDAACRRVFSGYSRFPRPCIPAPLILGSHFMSCPGITGTYVSQQEIPMDGEAGREEQWVKELRGAFRTDSHIPRGSRSLYVKIRMSRVYWFIRGFDTSWRTLAQSSPSTVAAENQCAAGIGIFVNKSLESSLQPDVLDRSNMYFILFGRITSSDVGDVVCRIQGAGHGWLVTLRSRQSFKTTSFLRPGRFSPAVMFASRDGVGSGLASFLAAWSWEGRDEGVDCALLPTQDHPGSLIAFANPAPSVPSVALPGNGYLPSHCQSLVAALSMAGSSGIKGGPTGRGPRLVVLGQSLRRRQSIWRTEPPSL